MPSNLPKFRDEDGGYNPPFIHANTGHNRSQKRSRRKMRGVGWTRQYSSARARINGCPCKGDLEHQKIRLKIFQKKMREIQANIEAAKAEQEASEVGEITLDEFIEETFDEETQQQIAEELIDATTEPDFGPDAVERSAKDLIAEIKAGEHDEYLPQLRAAEEALKNRKTVLAAITSRQGN